MRNASLAVLRKIGVETGGSNVQFAVNPENGRLIVIDFRRDPRISSRWVMGHVRTNKDTVIQEIRAAGFTLIDDKPLLRTNYFLEFRKRNIHAQ